MHVLTKGFKYIDNSKHPSFDVRVTMVCLSKQLASGTQLGHSLRWRSLQAHKYMRHPNDYIIAAVEGTRGRLSVSLIVPFLKKVWMSVKLLYGSMLKTISAFLRSNFISLVNKMSKKKESCRRPYCTCKGWAASDYSYSKEVPKCLIYPTLETIMFTYKFKRQS